MNILNHHVDWQKIRTVRQEVLSGGLNRTANKHLLRNRCISNGNGSMEKESINVLMVLMIFFQFFKQVLVVLMTQTLISQHFLSRSHFR